MMTDTAGTRTRDRSDDEPWVVAGVDTHKDTHHVAVLNAATGAGLGDMRVPATPAGYDQLHDFVRSHGRIRMIGIEGTGSYGAGLARALRAAGAPIREVIRPKRSQRRRGKSDPIDAYAAAGRAPARGRRPARGQDRHRPLRTDPGAPGRAPQRDEGPRPSPTGRSPPCRPPPPTPCAPAPHRLSGEGAHRRPGPHAPRPGHPPPPHRRPRERCAARVRRHRIPGRRDRRHRHRAARTDRPRRPDDARHQGAAPSTTATLLAGADRQPRPNPHRGLLRRPVRRRPDPPPAPGGPTATDSTAAATDRPTGSRTPTPRPPGDPRTKAYAARLTATGKNCKEILRCLKRAIAREAWHLLTHPQPAPRTDDLRRGRHERGLTPRPSRPPPEHPPGPDQRTRTRHTPRHHPHRSIPPMAQHPTTTDPHRLTPIGASTEPLRSLP